MPVLAILDRLAELLLGTMLAVSLLNLLAARRLRRAPVHPSTAPRVSFLVPARNEEASLRENLDAFSGLDYPHLEILFLDDESTDGTGSLIASLSARDSRIRVLGGKPLPPGWLGKNWACHQLAREATGEILVFCDADVLVDPSAIAATVAAMGDDVDALTALPRNRLEGWVERAVVPLVAQLPILALLPLPLVPLTRSGAFAVGNGQWLAFRTRTYHEIGGHAAVRSEVLEDMALAREVKRHGGKLLAVIGVECLRVRMYRSASEVWNGFAKNLYPLLGGTPGGLAIAFPLFYLSTLHPWATALRPGGTALPLLLLALVRGTGMLLFRHDWRSVLAHPLGSVLVPAIAARSVYGRWRGGLAWRGRTLPARTSVRHD
jgi:chlorobactene glucosyltransferase